MLHTHEVTGSSPVVSTRYNIEDLCNGSTPDSDSVCGGSNPSSPAIVVADCASSRRLFAMQKHSKIRNVPFPCPCGATGNDAQKLHAPAFAHFRGAVFMHEVLCLKSLAKQKES